MRSCIEYLLPKCLLTEVAACRQCATRADVAIVGLDFATDSLILRNNIQKINFEQSCNKISGT